MSHTPGPWWVDETKTIGACGVYADVVDSQGDSEGCDVICSLLAYGKHVSREQRDANARLIAAAPDLLAACEALLASKECKPGRAWLAIHDAVKKAKDA
jgi:hypothetical protein